ncbi:hypothetical protein JCM16358_01430 [Halanaerocella petrolearia]
MFGKQKLESELEEIKEENKILKSELKDKEKELARLRSKNNNIDQLKNRLHNLKENAKARIEEMKTEDDWIIDQVNQINSQLEDVLEENEIGEEIINDMRSNLNDSQLRLDNFHKTFNQLQQEIGDITQFAAEINDIADQTNLLALNASIEAARANGSSTAGGANSGAGFSVVAEEIKELATQTSDLLENITSSTRNIYQLLDESESGIGRLVSHLDENKEVAQKLHIQFSNIVDIIDQSFIKVNEINEAGSQHLDLGDNIINNLDKADLILKKSMKK